MFIKSSQEGWGTLPREVFLPEGVLCHNECPPSRMTCKSRRGQASIQVTVPDGVLVGAQAGAWPVGEGDEEGKEGAGLNPTAAHCDREGTPETNMPVQGN